MFIRSCEEINTDILDEDACAPPSEDEQAHYVNEVKIIVPNGEVKVNTLDIFVIYTFTSRLINL